MKRDIVGLGFLLVLSSCGSSPRIQSEKFAAAPVIVWAGLDYSMVKMIGTQDFRDPQAIFPGYLNKWNALFVEELMGQLQDVLGKQVQVDIKGMEARNQLAKPDQIVRQDGSHEEMVSTSHITNDQIAAAVKSYELTSTSGVGLAFIMDRLVKEQQVGCLYAVFFDIQTREAFHVKRYCCKAGGFGFRNYWFHPIKDALKKL